MVIIFTFLSCFFVLGIFLSYFYDIGGSLRDGLRADFFNADLTVNYYLGNWFVMNGFDIFYYD